MSELSTELDELAPALAAVQAELPTIPNTERARIKSDRGEYGYSYADLAAIMPIVAPLLAKHGLAFTCLPQRVDGAGVLVGVLMHKSGQHISGELPIVGRTPQEIGSSLTYGRRYLLAAIVGVVTDDDDDGQLAERAERARTGGLASQLPSSSETRAQRGTRADAGGSSGDSASDESRQQDPRHDSSLLNTSSKLARAMYAGIREAGIERDRVHEFMSEIVGREITSSKELTVAEAHRVLDYLPERPAIAPEDAS